MSLTLSRLEHTCSMTELSNINHLENHKIDKTTKLDFKHSLKKELIRLNKVKQWHDFDDLSRMNKCILYNCNSYKTLITLWRLGFKRKGSYKGYHGRVYIMIGEYKNVFGKSLIQKLLGS